ncbi:MAG: L-glutamate gamma-semialdehyde dehydrogenase [Gemmatales bacterium]|nr:MAG: L-glutamate gamma-semialdehyde dehydrogenase [Gemmatales bacterium]
MNINDQDLEELVQNYGREIFARASDDRTLFLTADWLDERLMECTMEDEAVKFQLFRFIDVLPTLRTSASVTRHLREYFLEAESHLPRWLTRLVRRLPQHGWPGRVVARTAYAGARRLARRFIAGATVEEAFVALSRIRRHSLAFTVDLLGEATITEIEADQYQAEYCRLIDELSDEAVIWPTNELLDFDDRGPLPRVNVSLKLSSLFSQFDPIAPEETFRAVRRRLLPIFRLAQKRGAFVNVDMEQYAFKDLTIEIFQRVLMEDEFRDWTDVGIAIQAYLKESEGDLQKLASWAERRGHPVWVRLVKGAYWDYETILAQQEGWPIPVFTRKPESDASFERCTRFLLKNRFLLRPAFGSHNIRNLAYAIALAQMLGIPANGYEIQMLYGMAKPVKLALVSLGQRVRVYAPFGQLLPGMAYLVRRLLENTSNVSFLRAGFSEHLPEEQLLMNPVEVLKNHPPGRNDDAEVGFHNEPLTDFSRAEARSAMKTALADVAGQLGQTFPIIINHRRIDGPTMASVNPSHASQIVGLVGKATVEQAEQAIKAARDAFPAWRDTSAKERADYLRRAANLLRQRRFELAAWQVYECAKQWREADADVAETIDYCEFYAQEMLRLAHPRRRDVPGEDNEYFYEPRGVTVVVAPWNFPMAILCGMTTAALVTGNTVVMKPAEQSSVVAAKLMEIFQEIELPPGTVNFLPGIGEEIGPTLTRHPDVAVIAFTGSKQVGLLINQVAAETPEEQDHVKRVIAEMGGKNAIIIDDDADLDEAVHGTVVSAFGYAGQKCSACSRVIVLDAIYDTFVTRLVEATRSIRIGPAEEPENLVGPVIDDEARRRIHEFIDRGKAEARLVYAADLGSLSDEGFYVGPHIFADVDPHAVIAQEEIFGPVLAVIKARDLDHALEIANGTRYALTGGIYSRSPEHIKRAKREFRVGNLYINRKITGALVDRQPFGGFKLSGIGSKAGGPDYLLQFLQPRTITENTIRRGFAPAKNHD